ncbi:MAG: DUF4928 family protein [Chloroflexi bacterium]|nr:DUF4928 family protein [Ardenticatenaceae bacterium]MBL1131363.1 DUF4928 domain-containing protein [Chloroflexota bacterium]NOG37465.1 DUF4928 family protein [Chloroflexota bacterium]
MGTLLWFVLNQEVYPCFFYLVTFQIVPLKVYGSEISIEDYVAVNIIELAAASHKELFTILQEIIEVYNRRLAEVETDLSLKIEV